MIRSDIFLELRTYLSILRRRWPFIVIPTVIVLILGVVTFSIPDPSYEMEILYIVSQPPSESAETNEESRQYTWITSQYVVNAIRDWSDGTDFAERVSHQLNAQDIDLDPLDVADSIEVHTYRSILELTFNHSEEETLEAIANTATSVLKADNASAVPHLGNTKAKIEAIDVGVVETLSAGLGAYLDIPLRIFVAGAAGLGLALCMEYVDPKIRYREQFMAIGIPLIGEIPEE
ncbi:MAG: hypothetical protein ACPG8W_23025 [Candidatus Promineifilaceae bacterium]